MVDIAELGFKVDSSQLRRATKDLDSLSKSGGMAEGKMGLATKGVIGLGVAAATAAASVAVLTAAVADQVKETDNWAKSLGIATGDLQALQAAAKTVGVDAGKMGDILKDVNEKIGEAFNEGTGEGAEALKLLGIEVESIIDLPVDEKLKAIGDALENVQGQAAKSAIGEMLANDFTLLLPLLEDGNAGLEEMIQRAYDTGMALSSFDNTALLRVSRTFEQIGQQAQGAKNLIAAEFAPVFILAQEKIGQMMDAFNVGNIERFVGYGIDAIGILLDVFYSLEMAIRANWILWTQLAASATGAMADSADAVSGLINFALTPLREALAGIAGMWSGIASAIADIAPDAVAGKFRSASAALDEFSQKTSDFRVTADDIRDVNERVNKSLDDQIAALEELASSPAYSNQFKQRLEEIKKEIQAQAEAEDKKRIASNKSGESAAKSAKQEKDRAKALKEAAIAAGKLADAIEKKNKADKESAQRLKDLANPVRVLIREYEEAKRLFDKGLISPEELEKTKERLGGLAVAIGEENRRGWRTAGEIAAEEFNSSFESKFSSAIAGAVSSAISDDLSSEDTKRGIMSGIGGAVGGAIGGPVGAQIGSAIGGAIVAKVKTELLTDISVSGGGATAVGIERITRSNLLGSSAREFTSSLGEAEAIINRGVRDSGRSIKQAFSNIGIDVTDALQNFSTDVRVKSGDIEQGITQIGEQFIDAEFGAIESFQLVNESLESTIERLGNNAVLIEQALNNIGQSTGEVFEEVNQERVNELTEQYNAQIAEQEGNLAGLLVTLEKINNIPWIEEVPGEIATSTAPAEYFESVGLEAITFSQLKRTLKQLNIDIEDSKDAIATAYTNLGQVTVEATEQVKDDLLTAVSEVTGVDISQAANKLNELTQNYVDNFFTESERLDIAVENASDTLVKFADLGVTTETSMESLRNTIEEFKDSEAFTPEGLAEYLAAAAALSDYKTALELATPEVVQAVDAVNDLADAAESIVDIIPQQSTAFADTARGQRLQGLIDDINGLDDSLSESTLEDSLDALGITEDEIESFLDTLTAEGTKVFDIQQDIIQGLGLSTDDFIGHVGVLVDSLDEAGDEAEEFSEQVGTITDFAGNVSNALSVAQRALDKETDKINSSYDAQIEAIRLASDAEQELAESRAESAKETISNLRAVQGLLDRAAGQLSFGGTRATQAAASASLSQILASGAIPDAATLEPILERLTEINEDQFATAEEAEFARAIAANQVKKLQEETGKQLTIEEQMLEQAEKNAARQEEQSNRQIELLEQQRDSEISQLQAQLDMAAGIRELSVTFAQAISDLAAAVSQAAAAQSVSIPSGGSIVSQVGSALGVSTTFTNSSGATGVIDTGAFGQGGTSASITIDPSTGEIVSSSGNTKLGLFRDGGYTGASSLPGGVTGLTHEHEGVLNAGAMRNVGIPALNAMNAGMSPADIFGGGVTIDVSSIVSRLSAMETNLSGLLTSISISSSETANIMDDFQSGEGIRINTDDGESPVSVNQV